MELGVIRKLMHLPRNNDGLKAPAEHNAVGDQQIEDQETKKTENKFTGKLKITNNSITNKSITNNSHSWLGDLGLT